MVKRHQLGGPSPFIFCASKTDSSLRQMQTTCEFLDKGMGFPIPAGDFSDREITKIFLRRVQTELCHMKIINTDA